MGAEENDELKRSRRRWMTAALSGWGSAAAAVVAAWWVIRRKNNTTASPADDRLYGTWVSDGERTLREWQERRPLTDEQAAALGKMFGRLRVTWTPTTVVTDLDGTRKEQPYRVVEKDAKAVVLRTRDGLTGEDEFVQVNFEGPDTYWLYAAGGPLREYFNRTT